MVVDFKCSLILLQEVNIAQQIIRQQMITLYPKFKKSILLKLQTPGNF